MSLVPLLHLNDSKVMPQLGFGLWQVPANTAFEVALEALRAGYRSLDGAAIYRNEEGLGRAVRECGIAREEIFVTTKLWNEDQGYDATRKAFDKSLARLGLESLDLYLIHWPAPRKKLYAESWRALVELRREGRVKSIGVSNFGVEQLQVILDESGVAPAVNQIELHPRFQQRDMRAFHARHKIATESWSPLGQGKLLDDPELTAIGARYGKSSAQVVLRWHLQSGLVAIPKSVTPARIRANIEIFDFALDTEDMARIDALDNRAGRIGPDPQTANF